MSTDAQAPTPRSAPDFLGLNIGCGSNCVAGWVNCDRTFGTLAFRIGRAIRWPRYRKYMGATCRGFDAKSPLPFPDASVDAIYEQHMLYTFDVGETVGFLRECHRVLTPGGIVRLNEDDLRVLAERYLRGDRELIDYVNAAGHIRVQGIAHPADAFSAIIRKWRSLGWFHDAASLCGHLAGVGFAPAETRRFRDSRLRDIDALEKDNRDSVLGQVWVEGVKP